MRRCLRAILLALAVCESGTAYAQTCTESSRPFRSLRDYIRWCERDCGGTWTGSQCVFNTYTPPSPQDLSEEDRGLAIRLKEQGNLREAEIAARRAVARFDGPDAENTLGTILHDMKRYSEAASAYRRAIALGEAQYARHNLFNVLIAWGRKALDDQAYSFAVDRFREVVDLDPSSGEAWYWLGIGYEKLQRFEQAEQALRKAMAYGDRDAGPHLGYMLSQEARQWYERDWSKAEALLRRAIALRPDDAGLRNNLGYVLGKLGRTAEEKEAYEAAARGGDKNARDNLAIVLGNEALDKSRKGDSASAEASYRAALSQNPDSRFARFNLGELLVREGRVWEAREHLERAAQLGSANATTVLARGFNSEGYRQLDAGNYEQARKAFAEAAARGDAAAADMLKQITTRQASDREKAGDLTAAERLYRQAMQDGEPGAKNGLAQMFYRQGVEAAQRGDARSAQRAYDQATRLGMQSAGKRLDAMRGEQGSATAQYAALLQHEADLLSRYQNANSDKRIDIAGELAVVRTQIRTQRAALIQGAGPETARASSPPSRPVITPFAWPDTSRGLSTELERTKRFVQGGAGEAEAALRAMGGPTFVPPATGRPIDGGAREEPARYQRLPPNRETPAQRELAQSHGRIEQTIRKLQAQVEDVPSPKAALTVTAEIAREREKLEAVEKQYESFSIRTRGRERKPAD